MKNALKFLEILLSLVLIFLLYVQLTYQQTYQAPLMGLRASTDSAIITRGKYLVMAPAHCWTCHVEDPAKVDLQQGQPDMSGGLELSLPIIAKLHTSDITPDKRTGIGRYTDEQLAHVIHYNLTPDEHALIPFMAYNSMSDADIVAIISYLRSTKPVEKAILAHDITLLGKILMRFVIKPNLSQTHLKYTNTTPDTTAGYGKYLAYSVTNCNGCHTQRGSTGEYTSKPFAGGEKKNCKRPPS